MDTTNFDHTKLVGIVASLEDSLKIHGFAWVESRDSLLIYYGCDKDKLGAFKSFGYFILPVTTEAARYSWMDNVSEKFHLCLGYGDKINPRAFFELFANRCGRAALFGPDARTKTYEDVVAAIK